MDGFGHFTVVINHEEQYSLWPTARPLPLGWSAVGFEGDREQCLTYIGKVWTDMRPASVRRLMDDPRRES
jgi:MbtH protein